MPNIEFIEWYESAATQSLIKLLKERMQTIDTQWPSIVDKPQAIAKLAGRREAYAEIINSFEEVKNSEN